MKNFLKSFWPFRRTSLDYSPRSKKRYESEFNISNIKISPNIEHSKIASYRLSFDYRGVHLHEEFSVFGKDCECENVFTFIFDRNCSSNFLSKRDFDRIAPPRNVVTSIERAIKFKTSEADKYINGNMEIIKKYKTKRGNHVQ